jgi:hypothetical protein
MPLWELIFSWVIKENPIVTRSHAMEFTVLNLCILEMMMPPTTAATGIKAVPGRIATPAPKRECRCVQETINRCQKL